MFRSRSLTSHVILRLLPFSNNFKWVLSSSWAVLKHFQNYHAYENALKNYSTPDFPPNWLWILFLYLPIKCHKWCGESEQPSITPRINTSLMARVISFWGFIVLWEIRAASPTSTAIQPWEFLCLFASTRMTPLMMKLYGFILSVIGYWSLHDSILTSVWPSAENCGTEE